MTTPEQLLELYRFADETEETMRAAVRKALAESRRLGVPISHTINGQTYYELPDGEITREDPWKKSPPDSANS